MEATASSEVATTRLEAALPSADAASALLGVTVLTPPLLTLEADPASTAPPLEERASNVESSEGDSGLPMLLAGAGALVLAGLLVALAVFLLRRAKRCAWHGARAHDHSGREGEGKGSLVRSCRELGCPGCCGIFYARIFLPV